MRFAQNKKYRHLVKLPLLLFLHASLLLTGCTSSWKAPVSSYPQPATRPAKIVSPAIPHRKPSVQIANSGYYRVKTGDTLYGIAWQIGVDYKNLARWNDISYPYTIFSGQRLRTRAPVTKQVHSKTHSNTSVTKATTEKASTQTKSEFYGKSKLAWMWPTRGKIIQEFKYRDDTRKGIKLEGRAGQKILAAESGKVVYSGSGLIGYGKLIIIKHNNTYLSAYGHNRTLKVKEGDRVTKGMQIAEMGLIEDGKPALHFEIRKNGKPVNPVAVLPRNR